MAQARLVITCPAGEGAMGSRERPLDVKGEGLGSPVEVMILLQLAMGAVQQKISEQARVVVPPFLGPRGN